jgi:TfoX/Sxy family transcriptional regulator of competence genes
MAMNNLEVGSGAYSNGNGEVEIHSMMADGLLYNDSVLGLFALPQL